MMLPLLGLITILAVPLAILRQKISPLCGTSSEASIWASLHLAYRPVLCALFER